MVAIMVTPAKYTSFQTFWPFYLSQHQKAFSRFLHYLGTISSNLFLIFIIIEKQWFGLLFVPLLGYGPAWLAHFLIENNKPATFKYPFWSLIADYKMLYLAVRGQLKAEIEKFDFN